MENSPHLNAEGVDSIVEQDQCETSNGSLETEMDPGFDPSLMPYIPEATDDSVFAAILHNTQLLEQVLAHVAGERLQFSTSDGPVELVAADADEISAVDQNEILRERNDGLERLVEELRGEVDLLKTQNDELASKVAHDDVVRSVSHSSVTPSRPAGNVASQSLTWEQRKQQILDDMENDSFDAESFLASLQDTSPAHRSNDEPQDEGILDALPADPIEYVNDLNAELERLTELLSMYEEDGVPIGSADVSIAEAIEADEVVHAEREKLRQLQSEWEERFRETEIEISLERAKLSRERLEVESINEQLATEVDELKRQIASGDPDKVGTRWMAKLGLISNT